MENSSRFFANKDCSYYPCHSGLKECNCLFCYCPMYRIKDCPGNPSWKGRIKVCTNCNFPHKPENYDIVLEVLRKHKND